MCGQCVLHDTGLTCPMTCPKTLRNGPCGGVRPGRQLRGQARDALRVGQGHTRVADRIPVWGDHIHNLRPPVDNRLKGTSSWRNLLSGRDKETPAGWAAGDVAP